jgi:hypothetical protein
LSYCLNLDPKTLQISVILTHFKERKKLATFDTITHQNLTREQKSMATLVIDYSSDSQPETTVHKDAVRKC